MKKITFIGAGRTIFAKNDLGDCLLTEAVNGFEFALYDIQPRRLQESQLMLENLRDRYNASVAINSYDDRKLAFQNAGYVI
ncbi:alpha-glucosidase/alpha-galactosidase, partial [Staphylococcus aureus]|uniref:family 4 glycosyl hydrolase n=1 Tax=Staphylococcus aureus TaxID=1280 RepID=UPI00403B26F6|nr:alpha-glucosidase/alpha-galactosidase [Staphylococcus aureus]